MTDGASNPEGWSFYDESDVAVDLSDLEIEFTIKNRKGGDVLVRGSSEDVSPIVTVSTNTVTVTLDWRSNITRYLWPKTAWFYLDAIGASTREPLIQGPVTIDAGSRAGG